MTLILGAKRVYGGRAYRREQNGREGHNAPLTRWGEKLGASRV
jgi:hypothetical protein